MRAAPRTLPWDAIPEWMAVQRRGRFLCRLGMGGATFRRARRTISMSQRRAYSYPASSRTSRARGAAHRADVHALGRAMYQNVQPVWRNDTGAIAPSRRKCSSRCSSSSSMARQNIGTAMTCFDVAYGKSVREQPAARCSALESGRKRWSEPRCPGGRIGGRRLALPTARLPQSSRRYRARRSRGRGAAPICTATTPAFAVTRWRRAARCTTGAAARGNTSSYGCSECESAYYRFGRRCPLPHGRGDCSGADAPGRRACARLVVSSRSPAAVGEST